MASVLSSVLEEVIKQFSENYAFHGMKAITKQSLVKGLKKRGVKDIELEQSGLLDNLSKYKATDKVPVAELNKVLEVRPDMLKSAKNPGDKYTTETAIRNIPGTSEAVNYGGIREAEFVSRKYLTDFAYAHKATAEEEIKQLIKNPNDTKLKDSLANMLKWGLQGSEKDKTERYKLVDQAVEEYKKLKKGKYTSEVYTKDIETGVKTHFDIPSYYSHTRYTDIDEGVKKPRVVHEIQTDVHQGDRKTSLVNEQAQIDYNNAKDEQVENIYAKNKNYFEDPEMPDNFNIGARTILEDIINRGNPPTRQQMDTLMGEVYDHTDIQHQYDGNINISRKELYRDIEQSLVYLADHPSYEAISKQGKFTKQEGKWLNSHINKALVDAANEGRTSYRMRIADDVNLSRSEGVQRWYEDTVKPTLEKKVKEINKQLNLKPGSNIKPASAKMTEDGYLEFELPEGADFKLPLYTATGIGVLSATVATKAQAAELPEKIQRVRDQGISDKEINDYLVNRKYDPNVVKRSLNPTEGLVQDTNFNTMLSKYAQGAQ